MKLLLTTYPRSGQHYLVDLFKQQLNYDLEYTHDPIIKGYDKYITIVRNPYDCILSWTIMEMHCGPIYGSRQFTLEEYMGEAIKKYILFYTYAIKNIDIFINYNDLINSPDKIINFLALNLQIKKITDSYIDNIKDNVPGRFLKTSTSSYFYEQVKSELDKRDLSYCDLLYGETLNRCIDIIHNF